MISLRPFRAYFPLFVVTGANTSSRGSLKYRFRSTTELQEKLIVWRGGFGSLGSMCPDVVWKLRTSILSVSTNIVTFYAVDTTEILVMFVQ